MGPNDIDPLTGTLPDALPETELEKRREEGL
jgi:hypothetical protein